MHWQACLWCCSGQGSGAHNPRAAAKRQPRWPPPFRPSTHPLPGGCSSKAPKIAVQVHRQPCTLCMCCSLTGSMSSRPHQVLAAAPQAGLPQLGHCPAAPPAGRVSLSGAERSLIRGQSRSALVLGRLTNAARLIVTASPGNPCQSCLWGCSSQTRQGPSPFWALCIGAAMAQAATVLLATGQPINGFSQHGGCLWQPGGSLPWAHRLIQTATMRG